MRIHGLRAKMFGAYTIFIILMFSVSLNFIFNLSKLGKMINGFMEANYKSIEASQDMIEALDESQSAVLTYIVDNEDTGIKQFVTSTHDFTSAYDRANGNITEKGEKDAVTTINTSFEKYCSTFLQLQDYKVGKSTDQVIKFYNDVLAKQYDEVKKNCRQLLRLNENAMFHNKENVIASTNRSILVNLIISIIVLMLGFIFIAHVLSNIFRPIYKLTNYVKTISEGNLTNEIDIKTNDEIGQLSREFNNMTKRLQHYDQMNINKIIDEKNKSAAIVSSISDPIIVTDINFRIVLINPAAETVFEIDQESALGKHFMEVLDNKPVYNIMTGVVNDVKRNTSDNEDIVLIKTKNKDRYFKVIIASVISSDNNITGVVTTLQDITHMKEVENLKSESVSTVSHEFRTPLTSISLGVGLLLDGTLGSINDTQREIVSAIRDEEQRLAQLVNNLLDLSRMESGRMAINIKPSPIEEIIHASVKSLSEQAKNKKIDLGYYVDEKLPLVKADPDKINEVLTNLIGNAIKFTPENGKIEVYACFRDGKIYVSVKDTGIGIPREYQEKIFEKFIQVKKDINDGSGTGLGLAIAKKIIELHGGEIWVESNEGKGSVFTFTLKPAKQI